MDEILWETGKSFQLKEEGKFSFNKQHFFFFIHNKRVQEKAKNTALGMATSWGHEAFPFLNNTGNWEYIIYKTRSGLLFQLVLSIII